MQIKKSSRHQHIIGKFGEYMLCNWLSRSGFEVAIVDHTGLDIVTYNPSTNQRLGITVKSRTRDKGEGINRGQPALTPKRQERPTKTDRCLYLFRLRTVDSCVCRNCEICRLIFNQLEKL